MLTTLTCWLFSAGQPSRGSNMAHAVIVKLAELTLRGWPMKEKSTLTAAASALYLLSFSIAAPVFAANFTAKVVSVIDGDTVSVTQTGSSTKERVILYGVDCPEQGQPFGAEAKAFTDSKCYGQTVTLEDHGKDPRGRTIAVIFLPDGTNLNQTLVKQGLAWWSDKYAPNDAQLKQLFKTAKASQVGLWSAPNPIPPWTFRNGSRSTQAEILKSK